MNSITFQTTSLGILLNAISKEWRSFTIASTRFFGKATTSRTCLKISISSLHKKSHILFWKELGCVLLLVWIFLRLKYLLIIQFQYLERRWYLLQYWITSSRWNALSCIIGIDGRSWRYFFKSKFPWKIYFMIFGHFTLFISSGAQCWNTSC